MGAGSDDINGAMGGGQLGFLDNKSCHVTSILMVSPEDRRR